MKALKLIIDGTVICFELFILLTFFDLFMKKIKNNKIMTVIVCCTYVSIMFISQLSSLTKSFLPIIAFILVFLLTSLFDCKLLYKLIMSAVISIFLLGSETLIGMLLVIIIKCDVSYIQSNIFLYLIATLFSKLLVYIIVKIIKIKKESKSTYFFIKSLLPLLLLLMSVFILIYFVFYTAYKSTDPKIIIPMALGILLFIFANVSVLYMLEKQSKTQLENQKLSFISSQFDNQLKHYEELYENQKQTYKIWHDMNKQLMGIAGLLETGDNDLAIEYINSLIGSVDNLVNIVNTGHPILDSIITINKSVACSNDINFQYKVNIDSCINIDKMEIGIIVGNALDNAIEACKCANIDNKYISLQVTNTEKDLFIYVENSTTNIISDVNSIPSTKNRKQKYGFGINAIKEIAQKYDGDVEIMCRNNVFYLSVSLTNKK